MITATIQSIQSRLLKTLRLLLFSVVFSLLFLQMGVGSAMAQPAKGIAQPSPTIDPSQRPPTPALPLENPAVESTRGDHLALPPAIPPAIPKGTSDTAKRDRPADPYKPYYNSMEKFNEEVYGEKG